MLETLHIRGYRSLRDFRLKLGRVTVVTGENGVGKSNLYRALALMQRMADGRFAEALAEEGGMPSLLWAGEHRTDEPQRISWQLDHSDFHFSMECGIIPGGESAFQTDPDVKQEVLRYGGEKGRVVAKRKGPMVELRDQEGRTQVLPAPFHASESMLSEVRDGIRFRLWLRRARSFSGGGSIISSGPTSTRRCAVRGWARGRRCWRTMARILPRHSGRSSNPDSKTH